MRSVALCLGLATLVGCVELPVTGVSGRVPPGIPGTVGADGNPVPIAAPYSVMAPPSAKMARQMMSQSLPLEMVQPAGGDAPGLTPPGMITPPGIKTPSAALLPDAKNGMMPPGMDPRAAALMQSGGMPPPGMMPPGMMPPPPGMMMPAPGMMPPGMDPRALAQATDMPPGMNGQIQQASGCCGPGGMGPPGAVAAIGALTGGGAGGPKFQMRRTSVRFLSPAGMKISWYAPGGANGPGFAPTQIEAPGRYNFVQAAIYRLKLTDIPNRPGLELYPTLEVVPSSMKTYPFLAHSAVPVSFTDEDFDQVSAGNYVVKVIYLPDPQFQDLAAIAPGEVVSTRLEPGVDPIAEAHRRGSILLIVRVGNIDLEAPNTPSMDAPGPYGCPPGLAGMPGGLPPGMAGMPGAMPPGMGMPGMPPGMAGMPGMPPGMAGVPGMPPGIPGMGGMPSVGGMPGMMPPGVLPPGMKKGPLPAQPAVLTPNQMPTTPMPGNNGAMMVPKSVLGGTRTVSMLPGYVPE